MRGFVSILAAAAGLAVSLALAGVGASAGSQACPLTSTAGGPRYTCAPLATRTTITTPDPLPVVPAPGAGPGAQTYPVVRPRAAGRGATFHVYLTARVGLGHTGVFASSYALTANTRPRAGCVSSTGAVLAAGAAGAVLRADLRPAPGASWCSGRFRGGVTLTSGPYCPPGPLAGVAIPCPEFPTRVLPVGHFSFHVR